MQNSTPQREALLHEALGKAVVFSAYRVSDPLAIRFEFASDEDRVAAANAVDQLYLLGDTALATPPASTIPADDPEAELVARFSAALLAKLRASEAKYGWNRAWMRDGWQADLSAHLHKHVEKGDPIDVAAYAAFAWHHGWNIARPSPASTSEREEIARKNIASARGHLANVRAHGNAEANACLVIERALDDAEAALRPSPAPALREALTKIRDDAAAEAFNPDMRQAARAMFKAAEATFALLPDILAALKDSDHAR